MFQGIPDRDKKYKDSTFERIGCIKHFLRHFFPANRIKRFQKNLNDLVTDRDRRIPQLKNLLNNNKDYPLTFNDRGNEPFLSAIKLTTDDDQYDGKFIKYFLDEIQKRYKDKPRELAKLIDPETGYHPLHFFAERSKKPNDIWHELSRDLIRFTENWAEHIGINSPWPDELTDNQALKKLYEENLNDSQRAKHVTHLSLVKKSDGQRQAKLN
jgi:hypothetical protein